jgi:antitoxin ParD1/3/4
MEMTSLNISLPKALKEYIEAQIAGGMYSTPSEYVRELIREERKRHALENLEAALAEGMNSGAVGEIGAKAWARKRRELRERHTSKKVAR